MTQAANSSTQEVEGSRLGFSVIFRTHPVSRSVCRMRDSNIKCTADTAGGRHHSSLTRLYPSVQLCWPDGSQDASDRKQQNWICTFTMHGLSSSFTEAYKALHTLSLLFILKDLRKRNNLFGRVSIYRIKDQTMHQIVKWKYLLTMKEALT